MRRTRPTRWRAPRRAPNAVAVALAAVAALLTACGGATVPAGPPPETVRIPTGSQIGTGRIPLTCDVPFLGPQTFLASATGAVATVLGPGQEFYITEIHGSLEVSDWIRDAAPLLGVTHADARVTNIGIQTTNATPSLINAVQEPLVIEDIPVTAGQPLVVPAPREGEGNLTVGPFTAGQSGSVELTLGTAAAEITLKNAAGGTVLWPLNVQCRAPDPPLVIAGISIHPEAGGPPSRYDEVDTPTFGLAGGNVEGSISAPLECTVGGLGEVGLDAIVTGELPAVLPQGQEYRLRQVSGAIILPAEVVGAIRAAFPGASQISGTIDTLEINSQNATPAALNVAQEGFDFPGVPLRAGQEATIPIPGSGRLTVGPWVPGGGESTTMTWGASGGTAQLRDASGRAVGPPMDIRCDAPRGPVILLRQAISTGPVPRVTGVSPATGPAAGGNWVTITGSGFNGAQAVNVGAGTGQFQVVNDTTISARIPAGSGTVDISVLGPNGPSALTPAARYSYG
jgi:hypothetical protein